MLEQQCPHLLWVCEDRSEPDWWGTAHTNLSITALQVHFFCLEPVGAYARACKSTPSVPKLSHNPSEHTFAFHLRPKRREPLAAHSSRLTPGVLLEHLPALHPPEETPTKAPSLPELPNLHSSQPSNSRESTKLKLEHRAYSACCR